MLFLVTDRHGLAVRGGEEYTTWGGCSILVPFHLQNPSLVTSTLERLLCYQCLCVCVLRAPLKAGSQHLLLLLLGSQVLGLANLQCAASIFQFLDGKVHLCC